MGHGFGPGLGGEHHGPMSLQQLGVRCRPARARGPKLSPCVYVAGPPSEGCYTCILFLPRWNEQASRTQLRAREAVSQMAVEPSGPRSPGPPAPLSTLPSCSPGLAPLVSGTSGFPVLSHWLLLG